MPIPFGTLNQHSESQYLKLEQKYINLFNFLESLLTITEGEDLDSDSQKISHFNALCIRINDGVERFSKFTQQVRDVMFHGNSATTPQAPESAEIVIYCTKDEHGLMVEALEHIGNSFPDLRTADSFQNLADDLINLKRNEQ
tara:strand:- start:235 stop:660 length:426 start_codon:yes stop_codon:yes gene_type:complete